MEHITYTKHGRIYAVKAQIKNICLAHDTDPQAHDFEVFRLLEPENRTENKISGNRVFRFNSYVEATQCFYRLAKHEDTAYGD